MEGVRVPVGVNQRTGLPPRPARVQIGAQTRKFVKVTLPRNAAGTRVWATVVTVTDPRGDVVARIVVRARDGERRAQVTVPFFAPGYSVRVYTVNALGVSRGGFVTSPLIHTSTIDTASSRQRPLIGTRLGRPVYFAGGSAALGAHDRRQLAQIARAAKASQAPVFVTGFARKGANSISVLNRLSTQRARVVSEYLASRGVRVWIRYWGAGPLGGDGTARDRRVEVRTMQASPPRVRASLSQPTNPGDLGP